MDYLYDDTTVYIILFIVAFFASLIDSIAGGGGLLTTPSMLLVGMPPLNVLATNKFQSCFGTYTSTFNYYKNGLLVAKTFKGGIPTRSIDGVVNKPPPPAMESIKEAKNATINKIT